MNTSSFQQINRSCINRSSSKQLYSFSKQKRFQDKQQKSTVTSDYYMPSFSEAKLKANSFSRSRRQLVFENQQQYKLHPSPNIYNVAERLGRSGISMAIRLKSISPQNQKYPGPATYSSQSLDRKPRILFDKQKRELKFPLQNQKGKDSPGPYLIQTQRLKNILSNYKNPRHTKITKKPNTIELSSLKMKIKAQQATKQKKILQKIEQAELPSTFRKSIVLKKQKTVVFDKQVKRSIFDVKKNISPGPASHQYFSQFAIRNKPDMLPNSKSSLKIKVQDELKKRARTLSVVD